MELALFVCARDEASTIADVVGRNREAAESVADAVEVLVIDDGSSDGTAAAAKRAGADVVRVRDGSGLANAFNTGVRAALASGATHLAHTDADGQYAAESLAGLCACAAAGADLVVGDRLWRRPPGMSDVRFLWNQRLTEMVSLLSGTALTDAQSGCRVFSRALAEGVEISSAFTYTQEQIIRAARAGHRVEQAPVNFGPRRHGASRLVKSPLDYLARVFADLDSLARELAIDLEGMAFLPVSAEAG